MGGEVGTRCFGSGWKHEVSPHLASRHHTPNLALSHLIIANSTLKTYKKTDDGDYPPRTRKTLSRLTPSLAIIPVETPSPLPRARVQLFRCTKTSSGQADGVCISSLGSDEPA